MMNQIVFDATLIETEDDRRWAESILRLLLSALTKISIHQFQHHPEWPNLYDSGIRYVRENGTEDWKDYRALLRDGYGDCEDLATTKAAELIVRANIPAEPDLTWKVLPDGRYLYHVVVRLPGGRIIDPSRALGMGA